MDPIPSGAAAYVYTDVISRTDPTASTPQFAFLDAETNSPVDEPTVWSNGAWFGSTVLQESGRYRTTARVLVGLGGVVTTPGSYHAWVKVGSDYRRFDRLTLT